MYWRVRVCPMAFEDFCKLFKKVVKMSLSFELRMSQMLLAPVAKDWHATLSKEESSIPWLPSSEKAFAKRQTIDTMAHGMG